MPADIVKAGEVAVVGAHDGVVVGSNRGELGISGEIARSPGSTEIRKGTGMMPGTRLSPADIRQLEPGLDVPGSLISGQRRLDEPRVGTDAQEAEDSRIRQADQLVGVDDALPPLPRLHVLGEGVDNRIKQKVDVRDDHSCASLTMASSSSSSASLLNPARSRPGASSA